MDKIVDVSGGKGGSAYLLLGEEKTALIDCGMAYCAFNLIRNSKQALKDRTLNYILISHSHYDHIGAIPYLKQEWPHSKVLGAKHAEQIFNRPNAIKAIRRLSAEAAKLYGSADIEEYEDKLLKVDVSICGGDVLNLGGASVKVLETPGHTSCSLSFLVNNEILFASESTGYMSKSGKIYPAFITSYSAAMDSIHKCQKLNPRFIVSPHYGLINKKDTRGYWKNCILAMEETKQFILHLAEQGYDEEEIFTKYEKTFRDAQSRLEQPFNAFKLNTQPMIKTVLTERLSERKVI
jgi:glyoxylase-like metal-dependent hydrolase (beta-lactamase superfamily II)